jgi:hypothetical protein
MVLLLVLQVVAGMAGRSAVWAIAGDNNTRAIRPAPSKDRRTCRRKERDCIMNLSDKNDNFTYPTVSNIFRTSAEWLMFLALSVQVL